MLSQAKAKPPLNGAFVQTPLKLSTIFTCTMYMVKSCDFQSYFSDNCTILYSVVDCGYPPANFTNATLSNASYETTYDSRAYYTCDEGYDPVHSAGVFSRCLSNGSWSEPEHPCRGLYECVSCRHTLVQCRIRADSTTSARVHLCCVF